MDTIKIAHLSDLHVDGGAERSGLLRRALARKELDVDLVVVTGDVTDDGTVRQVDEALGLLEGPRRLVVPGNHDTGALHGLGWESDEAGRRFGAFSCQSAAARPLGDPWPLRVDIGGCAVYGLNSASGAADGPERTSRWARGWIGPKQLRILDEDLQQLDRDQRKILVLHHHVVRIPLGRKLFETAFGGESFMGLEERGQLLEIIDRHQIGLVLHGHRHHFLRRVRGQTRFISGSSTTKGCGITGQRFFTIVTLELRTGAIDVQRVQYAPPAARRSLEQVFENVETTEQLVRLAEKAYDSEDSFSVLAREISDRAGRFRTLDAVNGELDRRLAALMQRAASPAVDRQEMPSPVVLALLEAARNGQALEDEE